MAKNISFSAGATPNHLLYLSNIKRDSRLKARAKAPIHDERFATKDFSTTPRVAGRMNAVTVAA